MFISNKLVSLFNLIYYYICVVVAYTIFVLLVFRRISICFEVIATRAMTQWKKSHYRKLKSECAQFSMVVVVVARGELVRFLASVFNGSNDGAESMCTDADRPNHGGGCQHAPRHHLQRCMSKKGIMD